MSALIELLHWLSLIAAAYLSFRLFRDLADLSQWLVQTPRGKTMWTFYHRHPLAAATAGLWLMALLTWWFGEAGLGAVFWPVGVLAALAFYSGYVNPHIMMRAQQHNARYYPIEDARKHIKPDTSLIVIEANGEARGHPDDHILRPHVAGTEDGLGGENVVMTYCGLTHLGIAYKPEIDGEPLELGVMTQLENNLVLWDKRSGEPIQQFWGTKECTGPGGSRMPEWPSFRMPLWAFEKAFPDGKVFLNPIPGLFENPFLALYDRLMHMIFVHGITDQATKDEPTFPTIKRFDDRLPNKAKIYGANVGEDYVAYTEDFIHEHGDLLNVEIGGRDIVVAYHKDLDSVGMYCNDTGAAVASIDFGGDSDRGRLPRLESMKAQAYWVVWQNFYPRTEVNRAPKLQAVS
ncbi:MAG: DUF3179 domain-containing protein, partial [Rhodospirillales bacterium]|nr:DUF3179 domain-containing protein [Rhodospirillales bacterium]